MVEGAGFEPAKAEPADLQSAPVDRLGTPPEIDEWCRLPESNWRPTDYKSVALPTELSRHTKLCAVLLFDKVIILWHRNNT